MNLKFYFLLLLFIPIFISSAFAEEQVPGIILAVESDPNYFSEGGLGIGVLGFFDRPLTPYLIPGKTTDESSIQEIYQAYVEEAATSPQNTIVNDVERAIAFTVDFSGGDITTKQSYDTFSKFTHLNEKIRSSIPVNYQNIQYGLELESLLSEDKMGYYDLVSKFINPGAKPQPFDVSFDYVSGDGTILQSWNYKKCQITDFDLEFADNLLSYTASGRKGVSEIIEISKFQCNGFSVNFDQRISNIPQDVVIVPSLYDMATLNVVSWYGGELKTERTSSLVQEVETRDDSKIFLGGLPNAQHKDAYDLIFRYLNPGKVPEPIDFRIDTITGDGTILFSTVYTNCDADNAALYYIDALTTIRYVPGLKSEIRGQSIMDCTGTHFKISP